MGWTLIINNSDSILKCIIIAPVGPDKLIIVGYY